MSQFDRIVRDVDEMGSPARIRDTKITVREIVNLALNGKSQAEILAQFPELVAEDIYQALGWYVGWSKQLTLNYMYELRAPLTSIKGYSDLLPIIISEGKNPNGVVEMLNHIKLISERMTNLVDDLMKRMKTHS